MSAITSGRSHEARLTTWETSTDSSSFRWAKTIGAFPLCPVAIRMLPASTEYDTTPPSRNRTTCQVSEVTYTLVNPNWRNQSQSVATLASQGTTTNTAMPAARTAMTRRRTPGSI